MAEILFYMACLFFGWVIQRSVLDGLSVYVPLTGWVFSEKQTLILYYALLLFVIAVHAAAIGNEYDFYSMALMAGFPLQIFLVMLYSNYLGKVLITALVIFLLYALRVLIRLFRARRKANVRGQGFRTGSAVRRMIGKLQWTGGLLLCLVALYISVGPVKDKTLWTPGEVSGIKGESHMEQIRDVEGALWDSNQEGLRNLKQEVFITLADEEKVESLQFILDLELTYLGCEAVQLIAQEFEDPGLMGYYNHDKRIVALNERLLETSAANCIHVCLHEAYHAYQYACIESVDWENVDVELRMYKDIAGWKYEFEHYSEASGWSTWNEYEEYANQKVEVSAREYADEWCGHYITYIEKLELVP